MTGNDYYHHNGGYCHEECPVCELDRIASLQRPSTVDAEAYYIAPDADGIPTLWRITDDLDRPAAIIRKSDFPDHGAWELLEVGVSVAQAMATSE